MKRYLKDMGFMFVVDMLAITLLWVVWHAVGDIYQAIDSKTDIIKFYGNLFFLLVVMVGPALHIIATIEFLKPATFDKVIIKGININKFLVILLGVLIGLSFYLKHYLINQIEGAGYIYCAEKNERASFSKIYVFVKSIEDCKSRY
jgi:hypothetical protein